MRRFEARNEGNVAPARQTIAVGGLGTAAGIVVSTLGFDRAGAALTLSALIVLSWGLHRFGRLGPARSAPDA